MSSSVHAANRRRFLTTAASAIGFPTIVRSTSFGANDRLTMGCIGVGGRGHGDMRGFMNFDDVQVVAVCDVKPDRREAAKQSVDAKYGNTDCAVYTDFREIIDRPDIDTVMIATPDHWHVTISVAAMKAGKDVFCEKPETLTIREGRELVNVTDRYSRVYSGGSQRVWQDYQWFHRMVRGGMIGEVQEVWINCGGPSKECYLPEEPIPAGLDWDLWLGPAPWAPYNRGRLNFRPWRDYSGGGMTDWGAHKFGGALYSCELHETGPVEVLPPDGENVERLTVRFANGIRMYHGGGWDGQLSFRGTEGEIPARKGGGKGKRGAAPELYIEQPKGGRGFQGDFIHCVRTRERPFRSAERAHRTVTVCHLANIAYWLDRPIKWDPVKEEILGDPEAARWLDRPKRAPWHV